jgi:hypothetical protein
MPSTAKTRLSGISVPGNKKAGKYITPLTLTIYRHWKNAVSSSYPAIT